MYHNYWTHTLEPTRHNYRVRVLQLLKPEHLEPVLGKRNHLDEKKMHQWASLVAQTVKNLPAMQETWVWSMQETWVRKIPWRREWQSTSESLPGKFHGQRSLAGYSPQDQKESDTTEWLTLSFTATKSNHPSHWLEKPCMQQQRPSATKNKNFLKSKMTIIAQRTGEYQVEFYFYKVLTEYMKKCIIMGR